MENVLLNYKFRCNSLMVTVVISLVIFMLMSGVVVLAYYNRSGELRAAREASARSRLTSAINFILSDTSFDAAAEMKLFNDVEIERSIWGLCRLATVRTTAGQQRTFLYGAPLPESMNACLYLADHGRPLSITGKTILRGDVYATAAGISYAQPVEGKIQFSNASLPAIDSTFVQFLPQAKIVSAIPDSLTQSFFAATQVVYQKKIIVLNNTKLKGRIVIRSDSAIIINSQCKLENIILMAPRIEFRKGFSGSVQAFAADEMIIEDDCVFNYPSCLAQNKISFGRNCFLTGILLGRDEVSIPQGTIINGIVYTSGHTALQGKVNGIVLTDYFMYRSATTAYENYLTDAEIDRTALSAWFVAPPLFRPSLQRKVMLWLE